MRSSFRSISTSTEFDGMIASDACLKTCLDPRTNKSRFFATEKPILGFRRLEISRWTPPTKNLFIITDLEGVAGVTRFEQAQGNSPWIGHARDLFTAELNAVIQGIKVSMERSSASSGCGLRLPVRSACPPSTYRGMTRLARKQHGTCKAS